MNELEEKFIIGDIVYVDANGDMKFSVASMDWIFDYLEIDKELNIILNT